MFPTASVVIGVGSDKIFQMQLLQGGAPFDLTSVTAIAASFPAPNGGKIVESLSNGNVTVMGAAGAGRIQIRCPGQDTFQMLPNPFPPELQDLQIVVTLSGVAQVDTLSIPGSVSPGNVFSVALAGTSFSYTAVSGDTDFSVFQALQTLISAAPPNVSTAVTGGVGTARLTVTSTIPGLGFTDVVSSNINKTNTTANGGTRSQFVLQSVLNIVAQPYPFS